MTTSFPSQTVSDKVKRSDDWGRRSIDYVIGKAKRDNNKETILDLLRAANGIIDENLFKYVLKPYGNITSNVKLQNLKLPGKIRNISLITPIIEKRMGEFIRQFHRFQVKVNNADVIFVRNEILNKEVVKIATQAFINKINAENEAQVRAQEEQAQQASSGQPVPVNDGQPTSASFDSGVPTTDVPDIKSFVKQFKEDYIDERGIEAQNVLDALLDWTEAEFKYIVAYYNWIVTGEVYSYRGIYEGEFIKEILSSLEYYPINNGEEFVEDNDMGMRHTIISVEQIRDTFRDDLNKKDFKFLNTIVDDYSNSDATNVPVDVFKSRLTDEYLNSIGGGSEGAFNFINTNHMIDMYHAVFKTVSKVTTLTYLDKAGEMQQREVSNDYKISIEQGDLYIESDDINEFMEGWRFGTEGYGIYIMPQIMDIQRPSSLNPSKCKSPYNGKRGLFKGGLNHSIVARLIDFDVLYKVYHLHRERLISKGVNNALIVIIPESMLKSAFMSPEENLWFLTADGRMIVNDSDSRAFQSVISGFKILNVDLGNIIREMDTLIRGIKDEAWDSVGWNRQRDGQVYASDGKGTNEQAIMRSLMGSVLDQTIFDKFRERDYEADLDYAKYLYSEKDKNELIGSYTAGDKVKELAIDGKRFRDTELGINIVKSVEENEKLKAMIDVAFAAGQHGEFGIAFEAIQTKSMLEMKKSVKKWEEIKRREGEIIREHEARIAADELKDKAVDRESKENIAYHRDQTQIDIAYIKESGNREGGGTDIDEAIASREHMHATDVEVKREDIAIKDRQFNRKLQMERDKIKSNERIAKLRKSPQN